MTGTFDDFPADLPPAGSETPNSGAAQRLRVVEQLIAGARRQRLNRAVRQRPELALHVLGFWTGLES